LQMNEANEEATWQQKTIDNAPQSASPRLCTTQCLLD
jgi:hypothetical protein